MENEIKQSNNDRKDLIRKELCNMNIQLAPAEQNIDLSQAKKIPLGQIAAIGAAFVPISEAFRTVTQTFNLPNDGFLMKAFDAAGNQLNISQLYAFKDPGKAFENGAQLGSIRTTNGLEQARLVEAGPLELTSTTTLPIDPATIAIAIALQQVNQKLDSIQKTADEILNFMQQEKKSEMHGNLKTLTDIINNYSLNWDNQLYINNAHMKVLDIKQDATQGMDFYKNRVEQKLNDKTPIEIRGMLETRLNNIIDALKDYQLATYIYAFASFLEPMLSENFKQDKLDSVACNIKEASNSYQEMYSRCHDAIESRTQGSIDSTILNGISSAGKFLGKAIASTPIGDHTPIDEALNGGGDMVGKFNKDENVRLTERLREAESPDVFPFLENVESINALYNKPSQLLSDDENLYLLPCDSK